MKKKESILLKRLSAKRVRAALEYRRAQEVLSTQGVTFIPIPDQREDMRPILATIAPASRKKTQLYSNLVVPNVLVTNELCLKISDFGLTRRVSSRPTLSTGKLPAKWMAPELLITFL